MCTYLIHCRLSLFIGIDVGDVLLTVDGMDVNYVRDKLGKLSPASTRQVLILNICTCVHASVNLRDYNLLVINRQAVCVFTCPYRLRRALIIDTFLFYAK